MTDSTTIPHGFQRDSALDSNAPPSPTRPDPVNSPSPQPRSTASEGKDKERKIEKAVAKTLAPVSADEIDLAELRLVLRRFRNVDTALEAHRLAQWASSKGETLTFPLRMLERWLEKARPMATEKPKGTRSVVSEAEILRRSAQRRSLLARCRVWDGHRSEGTLREVPMFTEDELDEEIAIYEAALRGAS